MYGLTMTDFLGVYASPYVKEDCHWMGILVTVPGADACEMIINPIDNAANKMAYYQQAYDENLVHTHNPAIKIVRYSFAPTLNELIAELD